MYARGMTDDDTPKLLSLEERMALARARYGIAAPKAVRKDEEMREKDPNAVALGARGGAARAASLSPDRREEIAKDAANTRWGRRLSDEQRAAIEAFLEKNEPTRAPQRSSGRTRHVAVDVALAYLFEQAGGATLMEAAAHAGCSYRTLIARLHSMRARGLTTPIYKKHNRGGGYFRTRTREVEPRLKEAAGWCLEAGFSTAEAAERVGVPVRTLQNYMTRLEKEGVDVSVWRKAQARVQLNGASQAASHRQRVRRGEKD